MDCSRLKEAREMRWPNAVPGSGLAPTSRGKKATRDRLGITDDIWISAASTVMLLRTAQFLGREMVWWLGRVSSESAYSSPYILKSLGERCQNGCNFLSGGSAKTVNMERVTERKVKKCTKVFTTGDSLWTARGEEGGTYCTILSTFQKAWKSSE